MAKQATKSVSASIEPYGNVRIRRFVVVRMYGKCLVSFTALRLRSTIPAVSARRDWEMICTLDDKQLPMGPDPYSNTGWRIERELTPSELERIVCNPRIFPKEDS